MIDRWSPEDVSSQRRLHVGVLKLGRHVHFLESLLIGGERLHPFPSAIHPQPVICRYERNGGGGQRYAIPLAMSVAKENLWRADDVAALKRKHLEENLPEAPVERNLLVEEDVVEAPFGAVLGHYGDARHLDAAADELAQIRWRRTVEGLTQIMKQRLIFMTDRTVPGWSGLEKDVCGCWRFASRVFVSTSSRQPSSLCLPMSSLQPLVLSRAEIPFTLVTTTKTPTPHKGFKVRQGGGSLADMLTRCRSRRRSRKGHFGKNCCNQLEKGKRKGGPAWKKKSCNCGCVPSYKWPLVPATGIAAGASPHTHTHTLTSVLLSVGGALQVVLSTLQMSQPIALNLCLLVMPVMSLLLFSPIGRSDENVTLSPGCHLHPFNLSVRSDRRGTCRGTHLVHACVGYCESSAFPSRYSVLVASNFTRNVTSASRCCTITKEAKVKVRLECPGGRHHDELEILTAKACRCDMCRTSRY